MKIVKQKTVAFSGYRKSKLLSKNSPATAIDEIKYKILSTLTILTSQNFDTFLCGMSDGFDLMCGEQVLKLQQNNPKIKLIAVIPFKGHGTSILSGDRELYDKIIQHSNEIIYCSEEFKGNYQFIKRNDFLLENSSFLLCYYDGQKGGTQYTYNKAQKLGTPLINLAPNKIPQQLSLLRQIDS